MDANYNTPVRLVEKMLVLMPKLRVGAVGMKELPETAKSRKD